MVLTNNERTTNGNILSAAAKFITQLDGIQAKSDSIMIEVAQILSKLALSSKVISKLGFPGYEFALITKWPDFGPSNSVSYDCLIIWMLHETQKTQRNPDVWPRKISQDII